MRKLTILILWLFTSIAFSQHETRTVNVAEFKTLLDSLGINFEMPAAFSETPVKQNKDLHYDFAMKHIKQDCEVRYTLWPLKKETENYKACMRGKSCKMSDPNSFYVGKGQAAAATLSGGITSDVAAISRVSVQNEFNADAGGTCMFLFKSSFGDGYKHGQFLLLHKDGVADVIITFMGNNYETVQKLMGKCYRLLTFR